MGPFSRDYGVHGNYSLSVLLQHLTDGSILGSEEPGGICREDSTGIVQRGGEEDPEVTYSEDGNAYGRKGNPIL